MPVGSAYGWGVCGRHIALESVGLTDIRFITEELESHVQEHPEHKGELLKVQVKIVDNVGNTIALKEFNIVWDFEPILTASCEVNTLNNTVGISNVSVLKDWVDPDSISQRAAEHLPGVYISVKLDDYILNYAS